VNVLGFPASVVPVNVQVDEQEYVPVAKTFPSTISVQVPFE
jgi:hypothetical protein